MAGHQVVAFARQPQFEPQPRLEVVHGDSRKGPVAAMAWMFLRSALEEHERQEAIIRASNLDWTIIRPTGLTFDAASGKVRVGSVGRGRIARADVAAFMLTCLTDASSKGRSITVST